MRSAVLCGGIFDYIPHAILVRFLRRVYGTLLAPSGAIFFTNIQSGNPYACWMECCARWSLIHRSQEDLLGILHKAGVPSENVSLRLDESGLTFLVDVRKN